MLQYSLGKPPTKNDQHKKFIFIISLPEMENSDLYLHKIVQAKICDFCGFSHIKENSLVKNFQHDLILKFSMIFWLCGKFMELLLLYIIIYSNMFRCKAFGIFDF
jgi:hypothetical protein